MVLEEYLPPVKELLEEAGEQLISQYERELLAIWRAASDDTDPPVEPVKFEVARAAEHAVYRRGAQPPVTVIEKLRPGSRFS